MANSFDSNVSTKLMRQFLASFESQRVLTKTVNTQMFSGKFDPTAGTTIDIKRPHQYKSIRSSDGNLVTASASAAPMISGKATATVQNYITVWLEWKNVDEALKLDQLKEITDPAAEEMVVALEDSFGDYMIANSGLTYGNPGTAIDAWSDIAGQNSFMKSLGVPAGPKYSAMNPFVVQNLAAAQTGLSADPSRLVQTAWEEAQIPGMFGGLKAISSNALSTYTAGTNADRTGSLAATPTATYLSVKDTMNQTLSLADLGTSGGTITAGETLEFTGTGANARSHVQLKNGNTVFGADGAAKKFRCTVTADATVSTAGTATVVVAGPAIFETGGAYNTISSALTSGDVVTIKETASAEYQPSLFYHKDAFSVTTVKLPKLYSTDTVAWTRDGMTMRVSKYSSGSENLQRVRFDMLPAFATLNPFFAGRGFGL